jgi:mycothiol synthase
VAVLTSTLLTWQAPPVRHFRIVVLPDARRRGIGTLLLQRLEAQGPIGVPLQCNCAARWSAGRHFLKRFGFDVARRHLEMELREPRARPFGIPAGCVIRPHDGTASDDAEWVRLDHEGYADDPDAQKPTAKDLATRRTECGFRLWLLEVDGSATGFVHATSGSRARIHSLVVAPAFRGRGLGRALLLYAIEALQRDGAVALMLGVRAENAPAVELYQHLAFEVVEETETWRRARGALDETPE